MNNHKECNPTSSDWILDIQKTVSTKTGQLRATDKYGMPVILEWLKTYLLSDDFSTSMKSVSEIGVQAYMPVEMKFLHTYPEVVGQEPYFKPFEPLFQEGPETVKWNLVEEKMQSVMQNHFVFDSSLFSEEIKKKYAHDVCFFVAVKDAQTKTTHGFITFLAKPEFAHGDVKVAAFAIEPTMQNRGLAKLLMSSLLRIIPQIKRIVLCTRVSNDSALRAYRSWGFIDDLNPIQDAHYQFNLEHWTFMEYKTEWTGALQKTADTMVEVKNA